MEQSKLNNGTSRLTAALFVIYLIALYWILVLKLGARFSYMNERRTNMVPFNDPFIFTIENISNVVIFIPPGIYAGILFQKWHFGKKLFFVCLLSLLVEALQYILRVGAVDITDLITNTLGGLFGLMIVKGLGVALNNQDKAQKFINIIAALGTAIMILLLVLLKMNLLPVKYK